MNTHLLIVQTYQDITTRIRTRKDMPGREHKHRNMTINTHIVRGHENTHQDTKPKYQETKHTYQDMNIHTYEDMNIHAVIDRIMLHYTINTVRII